MKTSTALNKKLIGLLAVGVLAATPALTVAAAENEATTEVTAVVGSTITVSSSGNVSISLTPGEDSLVSSEKDTVVVSTNNSTGYTLTLENADSNLTLDGPNGANFAPHSADSTTPRILDDNTWGYAVVGDNFSPSYTKETNAPNSISKWAGVPASTSPAVLKITAAAASAEPTDVWYGVKVTSTQPNGAYNDTVVYTATTN